jgi:hypothetical protein
VRCGRLGLDSVALVPTPSSFPRADGRWSFPDARSHCPDFLAHQAAHTQMQSAREGGQPPHVAPLLAPPMSTIVVLLAVFTCTASSDEVASVCQPA